MTVARTTTTPAAPMARLAVPRSGTESTRPWIGTSAFFFLGSMLLNAKTMPNWRHALVPGLISTGIGIGSAVGRAKLRDIVPADAPAAQVMASGAARGASLGALLAVGAHYTRLAGQPGALLRVTGMGMGIGSIMGAALGAYEAVSNQQWI